MPDLSKICNLLNEKSTAKYGLSKTDSNNDKLDLPFQAIKGYLGN